MRKGAKVFGVVILLFSYVVMYVLMAAQTERTKPEWIYKGCVTLSCVTETLNSLPADKALTAKVVTVHKDSFTVSNYLVWYQK